MEGPDIEPPMLLLLCDQIECKSMHDKHVEGLDLEAPIFKPFKTLKLRALHCNLTKNFKDRRLDVRPFHVHSLHTVGMPR